MIQILKTELNHAITTSGFYLGLTGVVLTLLCGCLQGIVAAFRMEELSVYGLHMNLLLTAISSDVFRMTLPIWVALPYTASFCEDIKTGFIRLYLHRSSVRNYLLTRLSACLLIGFLLPCLGILVVGGVITMVTLPLQASPEAGVTLSELQQQLFGGGLSAAFVGMFCATAGLLFSTVTDSRYIAYASPFVVYYLLIIFHERYCRWLYILYPYGWLNPEAEWPMGRLGADFIIAELTACMGVAFCLAARRRLSRL
ncbi:MAG: hypothetical protein MJ075_01150 [Oscillospiraceae bacterium]|nr:hypothetical protein [Oscillospiraceae bacterium]